MKKPYPEMQSANIEQTGKRILLTGATGFVGRQILRVLLDRGCFVRALIRPGKVHQLLSHPRLEVVEVDDLFDMSGSDLCTVLKDVDCVIHAAWFAEPGKYLEAEENLSCLTGTLQLARACAERGVHRFVGLGTCFEYDLSFGYLKPDTPLKPTTLYAACKVAAYEALSQLFRLKNISFVWCRIFYLYGEGEDARRLVPYIRDRLSSGLPAELSHGTQVRDFLEVTEAAQQIVSTAFGMGTGVVNVCSGKPTTIRQLAEQIADEFGRRDLLRFGVRPENLTDSPVVIGMPGPLA